ncbi:hypothetical protein Glove_482g16 [Diversispora epigaea]|uniref:Uncharacterized protein n=1 Tax=Diversispora epigaea TaxID=1348612 RepID=A0A397GQ38_9GLOM|nr:hypothetical protein Glove_482g16 [Diversispora epigaea]
MSELRKKLSQYIDFELEEIHLPITEEDKQLFRELITGQKEMTDIVMEEYRFPFFSQVRKKIYTYNVRRRD